MSRPPPSFIPYFPDLLHEGPTRQPVVPHLRLPGVRRRYDGLGLSLLAHLLILIVLVWHGDRLWSHSLRPGDPRLPPGGSAGGGGNRVAYITLPSIPRPPAAAEFVQRAPVTLPRLEKTTVADPVTPTPALTQLLDTVAVAVADTVRAGSPSPNAGAEQAGQAGGGPGAGQGPGTGGAGPGTGGGGQGGNLRPPEPRVISPPFDAPPKELRGVSLIVTFWVRVDGRVERYEVQPAIKDREYARKFDEVMRAFRFTPARAPDGTSVAGTTTISFTLPGKRNS